MGRSISSTSKRSARIWDWVWVGVRVYIADLIDVWLCLFDEDDMFEISAHLSVFSTSAASCRLMWVSMVDAARVQGTNTPGKPGF